MQAQQQSEGPSVWRLDTSHSTIEFTTKKLLFFTIKGRMAVAEGTIVLDEGFLPESSVKATIKAASIDTGNKQRDAQLKAAGFLDVNTYPRIEFESVEVGPGRDRDMINVRGALTIKNNSRDVLLEVTEVDRSKAPGGEEVIYYVAQAELDRYQFGVSGWRGVIGPKLKIVINVQANRV